MQDLLINCEHDWKLNTPAFTDFMNGIEHNALAQCVKCNIVISVEAAINIQMYKHTAEEAHKWAKLAVCIAFVALLISIFR